MKSMSNNNYLEIFESHSRTHREQEFCFLHCFGEAGPEKRQDAAFRRWRFQAGCGIKQP